MKSIRVLYVLPLLFSYFSGHALAEPFFQFQSSNIQILRGNHYEVGEKDRTIITLEHANSWLYGDNYGFVDFIKPDGGDYSYYIELAPRLSIGKMTGSDLSFGPVKDILIATTFEKAKDQGPQYLIGLGADFDIPTFKFFKVNGYLHDSTEIEGQTWHVTVAWNNQFKMMGMNALAEGFADFQGSEGRSEENQLIVPRLLFDVGEKMNIGDNKLWVGVEYQYWHNKFGIEGKTESVPQAQIKWVF